MFIIIYLLIIFWQSSKYAYKVVEYTYIQVFIMEDLSRKNNMHIHVQGNTTMFIRDQR